MFQPPGKERLWINSYGALTMASNLAPLDSSIDFAYPASVATMLAAGPTIQQHVSFRPKMHRSITLLKLSLDEVATSRSNARNIPCTVGLCE